jgi:hypothetical protein
VIALNAKLKFRYQRTTPELEFGRLWSKGFDDTMTKLSGYNGLRMEVDIKRGQFRRIEICGRRMDVDD